MVVAAVIEALKKASYIDLTTRGRKSGEPRTVELSFALRGDEIFCLAGSGGRVHWYRNLLAHPEVVVKAGKLRVKGKAEPAEKSKEAVGEILELFREKYGARYVRTWYEGTERAPVRIKVDRPE